MLRLRIIDLLTKWGILRAYKEILETQYTPENLEKITQNRIDRLLKSFKVEKLADLPLTDKKDHNNKQCINKYNNTYINKTTGGSSGIPLHYRTSRYSQAYLWAGIIRSLTEINYKIGTKLAFVSGSLNEQYTFKKRVFHLLMNIQFYNTFGAKETDYIKYLIKMKKNKIKYIYGYTNSILTLAKIKEKYNLDLHLNGIICTAEQMPENVREYLSNVFQCRVLQQYGALDGGVSAFECRKEQRLHLISTRCYLEEIDGKFYATDLINNAEYFIRYSIGDRGTISGSQCSCNLKYPIIEDLKGRENDIITDIHGTTFHSEFFTHYFKESKNILRWQVISENNSITIRLEPKPGMSNIDTKGIETYFKNTMEFHSIEVLVTSNFEKIKNGKTKFVIQK